MTHLHKLFFVQQQADEFRTKEITQLFEEAKRSISKAQQQQSRYYNSKRREVEYKVGQEVLKQTHCQSSAAEQFVAKFAPKFEGPYQIVEMQGNNVTLSRKGQRTVANVDQIKPYYSRNNIDNFKTFFPSLDSSVVPVPEGPPQDVTREPAPATQESSSTTTPEVQETNDGQPPRQRKPPVKQVAEGPDQRKTTPHPRFKPLPHKRRVPEEQVNLSPDQRGAAPRNQVKRHRPLPQRSPPVTRAHKKRNLEEPTGPPSSRQRIYRLRNGAYPTIQEFFTQRMSRSPPAAYQKRK